MYCSNYMWDFHGFSFYEFHEWISICSSFTSTLLVGAVIPDSIIWLAAQNHCGIRPGCGKIVVYYYRLTRVMKKTWAFLRACHLYRPYVRYFIWIEQLKVQAIRFDHRNIYFDTFWYKYATGFYFLYVQTQTCPNWSVKPSSRMIFGLNWQQIGKNPGFSSRPMIFRKNPGFSPGSRVNLGFPFEPDKFPGFGSLGYTIHGCYGMSISVMDDSTSYIIFFLTCQAPL